MNGKVRQEPPAFKRGEDVRIERRSQRVSGVAPGPGAFVPTSKYIYPNRFYSL